jgi:hypothetical protein
MASGGSTLRFTIEVAADQATEALKATTLAFDQAGVRAKGAFMTMGSAAKGAKSGVEELKTTMGRSRETAMFFTQALGEFGPQGRTAQIAISGVAGAIMGGGGLLLALSLAQAAVRLVVDAWEEEERAAKAAAEAAKKVAEERAKANKEAISFGNDRVGALRGMVAGFKEQTAAERAQLEVSALNAQVQLAAEGPFRRTLELRLETAKALADEVKGLEAKKAAVQAEQETESRGFDIQVQAIKGLEAFTREESARTLGEIKRGAADAKAYIEGLLGRQEEGFGRKIEPNIPKPTPEDIAAADEFLRSQQTIQGMQNNLAQGALTMGEAYGFAFAQMATGAQTFEQAMGSMLKQTVNMIINAVKTQILADAAASAAEAFKSQAGIPVVGPLLGAAAAIAALSFVQGLVGSVPSAAGGWKVPYDTLAMVHEDERILPARYSRGLDRLVEGGGGGGSIVVNLTTPDTKTTRRWLLDNSGAVSEALSRAIRDGRRS